MKKKLLVMLVAVMCIMLCACGSNEGNGTADGTEPVQGGSEATSEEEEFSIVGEWKDVRNTHTTYYIKEDGTFFDGSYSYDYEVDLESKIVKLGDKDFNLILEDGIYKMKYIDPNGFSVYEIENTCCLVPKSEHEKFRAKYEADLQTAKENRTPTAIEGIYWLCNDADEKSYGFYLDGKYSFVDIDSKGVSKGEYTVRESSNDSTSDGTAYSVNFSYKTSGSAIGGGGTYILTSSGTLIDAHNNDLIFKQVSESEFYSAFNQKY